MRLFTSFLVLLFCTGWFSACAPGGSSTPEGIIPVGEMVVVLKDISLVEARFQRRLGIPGINHGDLVFENYKVVFDSHNVTLNEFKTSYEYYSMEPEKMRLMYDSVIVLLSKEESELKGTSDPNYPQMTN